MYYDPQAVPEAEAPVAVPYERWRKLLFKAADLIRERGHCKYKLCDNKNRLCIHGALSLAEHGTAYTVPRGEHQRAGYAIVKILAQRGYHTFANNHYHWSASRWNDRDETTQAEVIEVLEAAAKS